MTRHVSRLKARAAAMAVAIALLLVPVVVAGADPPPWAFPVAEPGLSPSPDGGLPKRVPGSTLAYTQKQVDDNHSVPDWFPDEHPPMPAVVAHGNGDVVACAKCHLVSGLGHPESASLAALPAAYIVRQVDEFKSGARAGSNSMTRFAKAVSSDDLRASAAWFAALAPQPWVKVVEATSVPRSYVGEGNMRLPLAAGGTEPLGERIIELPQDPALARLRDPHAGFVSYVPRGSIARGETLVKTGGGGKTIPCAICHGVQLAGLAEVPAIAGRSPTYLFRQMFAIRDGSRKGAWIDLMRGVVAHLSDDEMISIAAYVASH